MATQNSFMIFGLQRSGTTFLEKLITYNYDATVANGSIWKHQLEVPDSDIPSVAIIKSPYTWVESIAWREPADIAKTYPEVTEPGKIMIDNSYGECILNLHNLINLYCKWFNNWYESATHFFRYEDLLVAQDQQIQLSRLDFVRPYDDWEAPAYGSLFMSEGFKGEDLFYYKSQTPKHLTDNHIDIINDVLGNDFFNETKYKRIR